MHYLIYAIIVSPNLPEFPDKWLAEVQGINNSQLTTVNSNGLTAIAGKINNKDVVANTENVLKYATVIDELFKHYTVLPVRYGTFMDSQMAIGTMMEKHSMTFKQNLDKVENKEEFSLKVFWDFEEESKKIRDKMYADEIGSNFPFPGNSQSKLYLLQKVKEHRFENALLSYVRKLIDEICNLVVQFKPDYVFKKMASRTMILDAAFLMEKKQEIAFAEAINPLKKKYGNLRFLLTGPWPPYNFVGFDVK